MQRTCLLVPDVRWRDMSAGFDGSARRMSKMTRFNRVFFDITRATHRLPVEYESVLVLKTGNGG
ncbi:hypothetical protein COLSTE_00846 [Collinsella stercoris DSM 13279]|uniref:Uncharacterized protein n=1 Tax=Collinsella stercoris DSM 13279 TaxID=445975 RepID=B6G9V5_9ACTN|nr:hypothetical protein COLSTE_00846 [Collinsella stercoris DSM 13279]